ncbi:hypothetical protein NCCP2050_10040 [Planococcus sp. NCCP-2050]|nr:hypothetical protein NCCP2050_10040 [Planococcus sp. NCCP-2050]
MLVKKRNELRSSLPWGRKTSETFKKTYENIHKYCISLFVKNERYV